MKNCQEIKRINLSTLLKQTNIDHISPTIVDMNYVGGNISLYESIVICSILSAVNPLNSIEFGTFNGATTTNMAATLFNCRKEKPFKLYTVDLPPDNTKTKFPIQAGDGYNEKGYIGKKIKRFNNTLWNTFIKQIWSDTALLLEIDEIKNIKFNFAFIDASHSYENCANDCLTIQKLMANGGVCMWHDYNGWPGVTQALREYNYKCNDTLKWINGTSLAVQFFN